MDVAGNRSPTRLQLAGVLSGLALGLSACTPSPRVPDLAAMYARVAAAQEGGATDFLIAVPGTLGSRLVDAETGTVIWGGGSAGISADPEDPFEARLIAMPIVTSQTGFAAHRDSIVPAGVLDTAEPEVLGIPVEFEVYGGVRKLLRQGGFRARTVDLGDRTVFARAGPESDAERAEATEALVTDLPATPTPDDYRRVAEDRTNFFRFDYDWRRDIPTLAAAFGEYVAQRKREVAALRSVQTGQPVRPEDVRFDLLAHSMGGLVIRYYLMYGAAPLGEDGALPEITWAGAQDFNRVVFVAPPNAGSVLAMDNLINGKDLGPFQPFYPGALLATHPAAWQLMPRTRHRPVVWSDTASVDDPPVDIYDPALWARFGWGLAAPEAAQLLEWLLPDVADPAARRSMALDYQARLIRRAKRFHRAMDRWRKPPAHLELFLVVGGGFSTAASAVVDRATGEFRITGFEEGDGVVLRTSVLLDERQGHSFMRGLESPLRFKTILFLPDEHVELTKNPVFGDNLLFWLLEQPRPAEMLREADASSVLGAGQDAGGATSALAPSGPAPGPGVER